MLHFGQTYKMVPTVDAKAAADKARAEKARVFLGAYIGVAVALFLWFVVATTFWRRFPFTKTTTWSPWARLLQGRYTDAAPTYYTPAQAQRAPWDQLASDLGLENCAGPALGDPEVAVPPCFWDASMKQGAWAAPMYNSAGAARELRNVGSFWVRSGTAVAAGVAADVVGALI